LSAHRVLVSPLAFGVFLMTASGCTGVHMGEANLAGEEVKRIEKANFTIREGEQLKFSIRWLGFEVGTADVEVKGISEIRGRRAFHIAVYVRSNALIDLVYRVRDEHHSYVDVERLHSLRYEKILKEGRYRADEVMDYDHETHQAVYFSRKNGSRKEMLIPKDVQDQVSCAFWFRIQPMSVGDSVRIPVNADEKNWNLEVKILKRSPIEIADLGSFDAVQIEPFIQFQGIFIHRGRMVGWMSADEKRLPLLMRTKIPILGSIHVVLVHYEGW